jgi:hypothetical protein
LPSTLFREADDPRAAIVAELAALGSAWQTHSGLLHPMGLST